jgi:predicted nucleic-acid-binding protein
MIGIDTNVLVRFLTQDDPDQAAAASAFMRGLTSGAPGFICREVMLELVWVLERAYGFSRADVTAALEGLLAAVEIEVEAADDVGTAVFLYRDEGFGFADLMIAAAARRTDATSLVTFDRKAAQLPGVDLLPV